MKTGLSLIPLCLFLAPGCVFDPPSVGSGDRDGGEDIDSGPGVVTDAAPVLDAGPMCWTFDPEHFGPCFPPKPDGPLDLDQAGVYLYDTGTGILTAPGGGAIPHQSTELINTMQNVRVVSVSRFELRSQVTLRAIGALPLLIASEGEIIIHADGLIDVSSNRTGMDRVGAGADGVPCTSHEAQPGQNRSGGAAGGGGGGFQGSGGRGGDGNSDGTRADGGPGGMSVTPPAFVRGGCKGGNGGDGAEAGSGGEGGAGGGAVQLTAQTRITVRGILHAGGAGGTGGDASEDSGAGAGGSGGYIGFDSPEIIIEPSSILAANGGGGGEGSNNVGGETPGNGSDATISNQPASGSPNNANGTTEGEEGSAGANLDGQSVGGQENGGGGGGGGGAGFILSFGTPTVTDNPVRSPVITIR